MRTFFLSLALLCPLALANAPVSESYVAGPGGPASWAAACLADVNAGAACVPLAGWEQTASVDLQDSVALFPSARWSALDAELLPLASGSLCFAQAQLPEGTAYFVVDLSAVSSSVIPECQAPVAGTAIIHFG